MTNLQKRVLTSLIVLPLSIYFKVMGGNYIVSFLYAVLILGNFEVFSVFKRKISAQHFKSGLYFDKNSFGRQNG